MATDTVDRRASHIRSVAVTTLATAAGVAAALVSSAVTGDLTPVEAASSRTALFVLAGFVLVQFPVLRLAGVDVEDFSTKDFLYVAFMTFSLWFVCWTILLTAGVSL